MGGTCRVLGAVLLAACAAGPPERTAGPSLDLRWEVEPAGTRAELELAADGSGALHWFRRVLHQEVAETPLRLTADARRAEALAALADAAAGLPRWAHVPSSFAGVRVELVLAAANGRVAHTGFNHPAPALLAFAAAVAATLPEPGAAALQPILELAQHAGRPALILDPRWTVAADLLPLLAHDHPDVAARRLAAEVCVALGLTGAVAQLRELWQASVLADGQGDYFVGRALLRMGDPAATLRVLDVALSSHPEWAAEATATLAEVFGRTVVGPWQPPVAEDPRLADAAVFRRWFLGVQDRLVWDAAAGRYRGDD